MRDASYESSILRIRLVINPAQQLCLTSPMQAIFVLIDLFWLHVSCLAIVRQTLQTRPSFGIKLRNNDPEVNPQVWAFVARKMAEIVTNKVDKIFIFYSVCWKIWCAAVRAFIVISYRKYGIASKAIAVPDSMNRSAINFSLSDGLIIEFVISPANVLSRF